MKNRFLLPVIFLLIVVFSCSRKISTPAENVPFFHTWQSLKEREYDTPIHPAPEALPPSGFFPWAGTVSHHLLAHDYIDSWFSSLAEIRPPETIQRFFILSPSHFGLSIEPYSITTGSWGSDFGLVESDTVKVREIADRLTVGLDSGVFQFEHGVSTLMPYIKKYFPQAKVVVIAYEGEPPVNIPFSIFLAEALEREFDKEGKQKNFLMISTDFSHQGNVEETKIRDAYSRSYIEAPNAVSWNMAICDNRPGIFVLDYLGRKNLDSVILHHTTSWEIANKGAEDVTSYFFTYFADKN